MKNIITISRQYGSGGRYIGENLAKAISADFYDKEILNIAAEESGIAKELFEQHDEKPNTSLLFSMVSGVRSGDISAMQIDLPLNHKIFLAQFEAIKTIAQKDGKHVFVGRCADYVLRNNPNTLRVFIYADLETKVERIVEHFDMDEKQAKNALVKKDRERNSYYNYFTGMEWGDKSNYDLCINTSKISYDRAVELIKLALED